MRYLPTILRNSVLFFILVGASIVHADMFGPGISYKTTAAAMKEYESTKKASLELLQRYPPSEFVYIGVGKSPTPLIAFIKATVGDSVALSIPLSDMGGFKPGGFHRSGDPQVYNEKSVARLREHLSTFIPSDNELVGKKIVIVDFAERGTSLENSAREIENYLKARNPTHPTGIQVVGLPQDKASADRLRSMGFDVLDLGNDLRKSLIRGQYKRLHEFDDFSPYFVKSYPSPGVTEYSSTASYAKPERRTRAHLQNEIEYRYFQAIDLHYSNEPLTTSLKKSFWRRTIARTEGFDTLMNAYEEKALRDRKLISVLKANFPNAKLLARAASAAPTGVIQNCMSWFRQIGQVL